MAVRQQPKRTPPLVATFLRARKVGPASQLGYQQDEKLERSDFATRLKR